MKTFTTLCASLALVVLISGCASSGYQRADSTAATLRRSSDRITKGTNQIDTALVSLAQLVDHPATDLKPQFSKFNTAVTGLESLSSDLGRQVVTMQQQGVAYFQKWEEDLAKIQNTSIRESSAERRAEVMRKFDAVKKSAEDTRAALTPFVADMKDIRTALKTDLTPSGLEAIRPSSTKVSSTGVSVRESLRSLASQYKELSESLSAAKTPPPAK